MAPQFAAILIAAATLVSLEFTTPIAAGDTSPLPGAIAADAGARITLAQLRGRDRNRQRHGDSSDDERGTTTEQSESLGYEKPDRVLIESAEVPEVRGPKRVVAVGQVDAIGAYTAESGPWDIGGGVAAMLEDALKECDQFIVVNRSQIQMNLSELELQGQQLLHPGSGPQFQKLVGVDWFLHFSITEFGAADSGGGVSVGLSGGRNGRLMGGAISPQWTKGKVAGVGRIVNAQSGIVEHTIRVEEPISSHAVDLSINVENVSFGGNKFQKTPLGDATRRMVTRVVQEFAGVLDREPWTGSVVEVDGGEVYINAGTRNGVQVGDHFVLSRVTKTFTDPETGQVLGTRSSDLGELEITGVEEKMAYGFYVPLLAEEPQRGDAVKLAADTASAVGE